MDTPMPDELVPSFSAPAGAVLDVLRGTRKLIAGGYSRQLCRSSATQRPLQFEAEDWRGFAMVNGVLRELETGPMCSPFDEGAAFFDLRGAMELAGAENVGAVIVAEHLLWRLLDSNIEQSLDALLDVMPLPAILAALDRAILRANAVVRRK